MRQEFVAQAERRSVVSIYILCRVLMEVIAQSTLASLTPEMEEKLEGIIFGQLKITDADQLNNSPLKLANWTIFSQLLGVMSEISFQSVAERFMADLERSQREIFIKVPSNRDLEGKIELLLGGMRYLRIKVRPQEAWDQSCDFIISMGRFFARLHGHRLKYACCQALEILLLPVAAQVDTEIYMPKWSEVLGTIGPRVASMLVKPRHWAIAFPLTATLLCLSTLDSFTTQWLQLILPLQPKFKDRSSRPICLQVISRLLWTYLYRSPPDSLNITIKKLDEVLKLILPAGRKTYLTTDPLSADPLIEIIRIIGFKHQEFCFRTIIFSLINADMFAFGRETKIEQLEPEKIVLGIKALLAIMSDLEKGEQGRPAFPQNYNSFSSTDKHTSPMFGFHSPSNISLHPKSHENQYSRPFLTTYLSDSVVEYYSKFCEILGKIIILCDSSFGGYAVLDERYNSPVPKTPLSDSFNFARRDDHLNSSDNRQSFYELLHVAVQALPRFMSNEIPLNAILNILCTGTAHVQDNIAESSVNSLKTIARQSHAEQVIVSFARFILNVDDKYPTTPEGKTVGTSHIENNLKLYIEFVQIWIEEISRKTKDATNDTHDDGMIKNNSATFDSSSLRARVDEIEVHGLFFLCSQSRKVRASAFALLRLVKEFDIALGSHSARVINILEEDWKNVITFNDEHLSVAERSRLQMGLKICNPENALVEICFNENSYDMTLWLKIFPNLIRICFERCPLTVALVRELISNRILLMYKSIVALSEVTRGLHYGSFERHESSSSRLSSRSSTNTPETLIEQWKLYLIFSCITMSDTIGYTQSPPPAAQHLRKGSKSNYGHERITSARILFRYIIPFLSTNSASLRDSVVVSLGSINISIFKTLLEELQGLVSKCNEDAKARIHQRTISNHLKNRRSDLMRTEVTHVYRLTAHYLKDPTINKDEWIVGNIVAYTKELKLFLMDGEVQTNWDYHKLRCHFCGLMEELFEGINLTKNIYRWITFESRKSSFALMEDWCGFSPNQSQAIQRENCTKQVMIDHHLHGERGIVTAAMEVEKRNLKTAALSAMAALCGGPLSFTTESCVNLQFDIRRILSWIDAVLSAGSDRMTSIGKKALWNLISRNLDFPYLVEHSIARCYITEQPKIIESYFDVIFQVIIQYPDYSIPFWRLLAIGLFILGSETAEIRPKSVEFLRVLEDRQQRNSKIQDYKISISDRTKAIYKLAQLEISKWLSNQYPDVAFFIFSEFTAYFKNLSEDSQRNMIAVLLPWVQLIELQIDSCGRLTSQSYAFLCNICEITIRSGAPLHNDVQALWQALTAEPHAGNLQLALSFIMSLCLDRREQNSVEYAKQTIVYLSETSAGTKVIEFLLMQVKPKSMVPNDKCELITPTTEAAKVPYTADLNEILPTAGKSVGFSLGQLSLILLVDLIVSPSQLVIDNLALLLQVVTSLWDHYIPTVQNHAREMLVHLIHVLVLTKVHDDKTIPSKDSIEDFAKSIRNLDPMISWSHGDHLGNDETDKSIPLEMKELITRINEIFNLMSPQIQENWANLSLNWATSCTMRHIACRSFQIFRCLSTSLDQSMLAEMLARLSNTIADDHSDIQAFSIEILMTLRTFICKLESRELLKYPQLFWVICSCLDTVNEREFQEVLRMLEEFMARLELGMSNVRSLLSDVQPIRWEGDFEGLQLMLYKGLRSSTCLDMTLRLINRLTQLPNDNLIGDDSRLLFAILANLPGFLHAMDQNLNEGNNVQISLLLAEIAKSYGCSDIFRVLSGYAGSKYRTSKEFLAELISAIKDIFLPTWDFRGLVFLMGFLTNNLSWFKLKTLHILCAFIAEIDMNKPEITSHGADLISPLLRLLQTEYCTQALQVLDQIMIMGGTSMDKQYLRMSMILSPSKITRKEFAHTPSLFGIPEESGWSVPIPAKYAEMTRANVLTVYYSCQNSDNLNPDLHSTHKFDEIKFHNDDFRHGYTQSLERAETLISDEGRGEGNISDLILKLNSLDEFFEDSLQSPDDTMSSLKCPQPGFSTENYEADARVYDEQTLPILYKSLLTTSDSSSFQNDFADIRLPRFNTMNPGAFVPLSPSRSSLHLRSVTLPSAPVSSQSNGATYMSDDDYNEVFSDGDEERHTPQIEGSFFLENIIKPLPQGIRSGMRRLTGGRNRDNDRLRENLRNDRKGFLQSPKSPKVPKVPSNYLHKTMMSPGS